MSGPALPPAGKAWLGIATSGRPSYAPARWRSTLRTSGRQDEINYVEGIIGRTFDLVRYYYTPGDNLQGEWQTTLDKGGIPFINFKDPMAWSTFAAGGTSGSNPDGHIDEFANKIKGLKAQGSATPGTGLVIVSPWAEPAKSNGTAAQGSAADYKAAFAHLKTRAALGAQASYACVLVGRQFDTWSVADPWIPFSIIDFYGYDPYNRYPEDPGGNNWRTFADIIDVGKSGSGFKDYVLTHRSGDKPALLGEVSCMEDGPRQGVTTAIDPRRRQHWWEDAAVTMAAEAHWLVGIVPYHSDNIYNWYLDQPSWKSGDPTRNASGTANNSGGCATTPIDKRVVESSGSFCYRGSYDYSGPIYAIDGNGAASPSGFKKLALSAVMTVGGTIAAPTILTAPSITEASASVGQTLHESDGAWTGSPTFTRNWQRSTDGGTTWVTISGETAQTYLVLGAAGADLNALLAVNVHATNAGGTTSRRTAPVGPVTSAPAAPTITALTITEPNPVTLETIRSTATITDANTVTYQWRVSSNGGTSWANGAGTTNLDGSYVVAQGDFGKIIDVVVTATGAGGTETATSAATAAVVNPPPGVPVLVNAPDLDPDRFEATLYQGQVVTCHSLLSDWTNSPTSLSYEWRRRLGTSGTFAAFGAPALSTYTPVSGDVGYQLGCWVTATNASGSSSAASSNYTTVVAAAAAPSNTSLPTVSDTTPVTGQVLTGTVGAWTGGPPPAASDFAVQWQRLDGATWNPASGAGAATLTYTVDPTTDLGHALRLNVTATTTGGTTSAQSAATSVVASPPVGIPVLTAQPVLSPDPSLPLHPGAIISTTTGSWTNSPTGYAYQLQHSTNGGSTWSNQAGAAADGTYQVQSADVGSLLRIVVTASNATGPGTPAASTASAAVTREPAYTITFGTPTVGARITTNPFPVQVLAAPQSGAPQPTAVQVREVVAGSDPIVPVSDWLSLALASRGNAGYLYAGTFSSSGPGAGEQHAIEAEAVA